MKHVKYCLLGAQAFPLELVNDLMRVFPNCTLGQVYGWLRDILYSYRRSDLPIQLRTLGDVDGGGDNPGISAGDAKIGKRREVPARRRL